MIAAAAAPLVVGMLASIGALPPYGTGHVLFHLRDPTLTESSGLAVGTGGVLYTHEDSGSPPQFEALDKAGRTVTTYRVPGVRAVDWEDMARAPDEQGRSCLWFADTGDNRGNRSEVAVVRVREPQPTGNPGATTGPATVFRLAYPDGPHDAEALLVSPRTGRLWLVTKSVFGAAVYQAPVLQAGPLLRLHRVASLDLGLTGTAGGPAGPIGQVLVTGGAVAPDGRRVALRTYTDLYEWPATGDDLGAALAGQPTRTPLAASPQGESVTYRNDGRAVLVGSEGRFAAVSELPAGSATTSAAPPASTSATTTAGGDTAARTDEGRPWWPYGVLAGAVGLAVAAVLRRSHRVAGDGRPQAR